MIKDLNINGVLYAKYEIENNILYLHMIKNKIPALSGEKETEDFIVWIIQVIENTPVSFLAYLNINAKHN